MSGILNALTKFMQSSLIDDALILDDGASAAAGYSGAGDNVAQVDGGDGYIEAWEPSTLDDASPLRTWYFLLQITSTDYGDLDEVYKLKIEESDTSNFAAVRKTTEITLTKFDLSAGAILDGLLGIALAPSFNYVRFVYNLAGSTPNLKVGKGWAVPVPNN
jgi:hypothetical protein